MPLSSSQSLSSTDIYLPAMPVMAAELQGDAELTITGFLIGFALAQLVWGPISDHLGRRTLLFIGMVLFIIGSSDVYIRYYGVAPQHYGWLFAVNIIGVMAMSVVILATVRHGRWRGSWLPLPLLAGCWPGEIDKLQ
ncbi:MFS transporter [Klebsiella oxytoca]